MSSNSNILGTDVTEWRLLARDRQWCAQVTATELDEIVQALLSGSGHQHQQDVTAVLLNVLLVNRGLHHQTFTPIYSNACLNFIIDSLWALDSPTKADTIACFRLIFLILYDGLANPDNELLSRVAGVVDRGLEYSLAHHPDALAVLEVLKAMHLLYHKHPDFITDHSLLVCAGYFTKLARSETSDQSVLKQLLNVITAIMMLLTQDRRNDISYLCRNSPEFGDAIISYIGRQLSVYLLDPVSTDIGNVMPPFILITCITKLNDRLHLENVLVQIFQRELIANDQFIPGTYCQVVNVLAQLVLTLNQEGVSLTDEMQRHQLKLVVMDCYFELTRDQDSETHFRQFLLVVGYIYAKLYLDANGYEVPPLINIEEYIRPRYVVMNDSDAAALVELDLVFSLNQSFKLLLSQAQSQLLVETQNLSPPEMLYEEKEREAEKLMVLFDRLEKTGVFSNPMREWQQLGKLEHTD